MSTEKEVMGKLAVEGNCAECRQKCDILGKDPYYASKNGSFLKGVKRRAQNIS
jgi:hypothetical protein